MSALLKSLYINQDNWISSTSVHEVSSFDQKFDERAYFIVKNHQEAMQLIIEDRTKEPKENTQWRLTFIEAMVEFLIWSRAPIGKISDEDMAWLESIISEGASPSLPALLFALCRELNEVPQALLVHTLSHPQGRILI